MHLAQINLALHLRDLNNPVRPSFPSSSYNNNENNTKYNQSQPKRCKSTATSPRSLDFLNFDQPKFHFCSRRPIGVFRYSNNVNDAKERQATTHLYKLIAFS